MYLKKNNVDILKSNVLLNILNICIYDQQKRFFVFYGWSRQSPRNSAVQNPRIRVESTNIRHDQPQWVY
jgi:hypothetical protein